jgi:hypothetical protein
MIAGVVLLLGYRFVDELLTKGCEIEKLELADALEGDIKRHSAYGSYHEPAYPVPCRAESVCFIDKEAFEDDDGDGYADGIPGFTHEYASVQSEARRPSDPPNSIFLVEKGVARALQLYSDRVTVAGDALCVNETSGRFRIGMEGKGRTVVLSDAS